MIITGYPCIGKSFISKVTDHIIDLESSCFWVDEKRPEDWITIYAQLAIHLSRQGYIVMVSSHPEVRAKIYEIKDKEIFCAIFPSLELKDKWIAKLKDRVTFEYKVNPASREKNLKALNHAYEYYDEDIKQLMLESSYEMKWYDVSIALKTTNYKLLDIINKIERETC